MDLFSSRALAGAAIVLSLAAPIAALAAEACPTLEVAPVAEAGSVRTVRDTQDKPVSVGAPLATLADVTSASANAVDGVNVNVRPGAGARLRAHTAAHIGKQIAVVIDGRARLMTVRAALTGDTFRINPINLFDARTLAGRFNDCVTR